MDSDSDSDASHISSTPPRNLPPPPPPPPSPPPPQRPLPPILLSSIKTRTKVKAAPQPLRFSNRAKPPPKRNPKTSQQDPSPNPNPNPKLSKSNPKPPHQDPSPNPNPKLSDLPFPIRLHSDPNHTAPDTQSTHNFRAGHLFLPKLSFSKSLRSNLNFESTEIETPQPKSEAIGGEASNGASSVKTLKRHPNSISGNVSINAPVKRKCVNEGNFVRLNINGYGRKFTYKGKNKKYGSSSGRKSFRWRRKGKPKGEGNGEAEMEMGVFCDEDGLILECVPRDEVKEGGGLGLIEEAVLEVRKEVSDESLLKLLKLTHGYDSFRDGQLEAIKMVLAGKSTMLVLPTGAGKSLCYQLSALVLPGITLVVSPLVALMIDQLKHLPPMIQGGLICSNQSLEEASKTLRQLQEGAIKVLFVSPERFLNAEFISIFSATPLISLVVVDEAHCISEWSHNFRPSYMRLRASLLKDMINVQCILAMTATATTKTLKDVLCALEIPPTNLIQTTQLRDNLQLSVSLSKNRLKDLMALLKSSPFVDIRSIIIYCKFQSETDLISKYLCDNSISAKSYHSGIPAKDRSRTQELFCSNKIRVVVATVAFGMGLDKRDVGAVIHYSLPESLEEYVQEIGRAGRDGTSSYCHLLFDDVTYFKLRSLMHSDGVDEYAVNKFLCQVFSTDMDSPGKISSLVKESASRKYDMKEEVILTILTHLELQEAQYLRLLPQINVTCTLNFHQTSPALLAAKDILIAAILKKSETKHGQHVFDIPIVANSIGVSAIDITNQLWKLKLKGEITYEMKDPAYCYTIVDVPKDLCSLTTELTKWLSDVESCKVRKIDAMFNAAVSAVKVCEKTHGCNDAQHTPCLQRHIFEYFSGDGDGDVPNTMAQSSPFLRADIKVFVQSNSHAKFTPRAIARIMHGIASPAYPSATWSKTHFWWSVDGHPVIVPVCVFPMMMTIHLYISHQRKHWVRGRYMQTDFQVVTEAAKVELMNFVGKDVI